MKPSPPEMPWPWNSCSADSDLVGQERMIVGQVEGSLLGELLGMVRPRATLQDDIVLGADHMEVADPTTRPALDVAFNALRKFLSALAPSRAPRVLPRFISRHASLPDVGQFFGTVPHTTMPTLHEFGKEPR